MTLTHFGSLTGEDIPLEQSGDIKGEKIGTMDKVTKSNILTNFEED